MLCLTCQKDGFTEEELTKHRKTCKGPDVIKHKPVDSEKTKKPTRKKVEKTNTKKDLKLED